MPRLWKLDRDECRYPVTDEPPYIFCGRPTDGRTYCAKHHEVCHVGHGKPWQGLAGMIEATEHTVVRSGRRTEAEAIDEILREIQA